MDEQDVDQVQGQEDGAEGNVEGADETAPMEQGTPDPSTPRDAPEPQRFDTSPRGSSPKRRVGNDDMEDDSQDKRPRPRSPTVSYRTDAESVGSNMDGGEIGMLDETNKKILSASIMGVDITEIYSP